MAGPLAQLVRAPRHMCRGWSLVNLGVKLVRKDRKVREMQCFLYILYSSSLDRYYIGSSENPQKRLEKHLGPHTGFTSKAKDWKICLIEIYPDRKEALKRERQLKGWKNRTRIESLINKLPH